MELYDNEYWQWIDRHACDDADRLRLSCHGDSIKMDAIMQIDCRQRTRKKLHQTLRQVDKFIFPNTLAAEQCTGDDAARYHASLIDADNAVLDMTYGLGIDAMHIAKKARILRGYDLKEDNVEVAKRNLASAQIENVEVHCCDSIEYLMTCPADSYDVIFIDPARRGSAGQRVYGLEDCTPDVTAIMTRMLEVANKVIIKASPMLDISHTLSILPGIGSIIALGDRSECKELIIIMEREVTDNPIIKSVTLEADNEVSEYSYIYGTQPVATSYTMPSAGDTLLIPYPSLMKTGAYRFLSAEYGIDKISKDSHLFFSKKPIEAFPGKYAKIIETLPFKKSEIARISRLYPKAEVAVRGFSMSAPELSKRLKVKAGGDAMIYGVTDAEGDRQLIVSTSQTYEP